MRIGLLSDTHGFLDDAVFHHFAECDEVWHAGDFGTTQVLDRLRAFKPVRGVYGNVDGAELRADLPEDLVWDCEGVNFYMTHIGGVSRQLRPSGREGSPSAVAGPVHLRPLPHPESHARPGARPRSHESRRLRPQWMAPRPNPAAIYRGRREDIRRAGSRTGSARAATSRR